MTDLAGGSKKGKKGKEIKMQWYMNKCRRLLIQQVEEAKQGAVDEMRTDGREGVIYYMLCI